MLAVLSNLEQRSLGCAMRKYSTFRQYRIKNFFTAQGRLLGIMMILLSPGCSAPLPAPNTAAKAASSKSPVQIKMEPFKLQVIKGGANPVVEVLDPGFLFEAGGRHLSAKQYLQAVASYDKLLKNFPSSRFISPALYNTGLAFEWMGKFDQAAVRYQKLIRRFGPSKEAIDAGFRLGGCFAELANWPTSAQTFAELLARKDLSASDRIEAMSRMGLAYFRLGDMRACKSTLRAVGDFHNQIETMERLDTDFFLAMAQYYLAAIPHLDFRNLKVDPGKKMASSMDHKARLLLLSQAGYIKAIKVKNPYWATAAGFQIGSLYQEFYRVLVTTLPDFKAKALNNAKLAKITVEQAEHQLNQVYMEEVHKTVKPLLSKAIRVFETNVLMAERVGIKGQWVGKSQHQLNGLKHLLSLPPQDAIKIILEEERPPEDQPAGITPPESQQLPSPDLAPARPGDKSQEQELAQPGRVIL